MVWRKALIATAATFLLSGVLNTVFVPMTEPIINGEADLLATLDWTAGQFVFAMSLFLRVIETLFTFLIIWWVFRSTAQSRTPGL